MLSSCSLLWAQEAHTPEWSAPVVQEVRMPAGVEGGVYYPSHDELVIIKPGAWKTALSVDSPVRHGTTPATLKKEDPAQVHLTLSGHLKLREAVGHIAGALQSRVVMGAGVEDQDVVLDLKDVPATEALRSLLYPLGYGFKLGAELMILAKDTRTFRLSLPPVAQAFTTATSNESSNTSAVNTASGASAREGRMRVGAKVQVENMSQGLSYWNDVEANIKGLISADGVMSFNRNAGLFVVTDTPVILDQINTLVDEMNARATEQIKVDVKVVEVTLSKEHKLGIDWGALGSAGSLKAMGFTTNFASENMAAGNMMTFTARMDKDGSGDSASGVKAVIKALGSFGRVDMVSQPRLTMLNNSVASIQVGETRAYVESTNTETTQSGGTITSASLNEVHGGVTLQIIGSIAGDDVFLNVTPVVSTIENIRTITLGGGNKLEAPDTSIKTISTQVRVRAGQTIAIGGLITREGAAQRQGVPFLSRIPVLGRVFSYDERRNSRTELVIFMTPARG
ncbi:MAG: hypothetical protein HQL17_03340 [Candidatus Omnitrophica bacterium]|nr:hypothetical protein [Candidatus Omnitrophota bacterium]